MDRRTLLKALATLPALQLVGRAESAQDELQQVGFKDYLTDENNAEAVAAMASRVGQLGLVSPLPAVHLWGPQGCGKTHLVLAAMNEIRRLNPKATGRYVSAERFCNEFRKADFGGKRISFRREFIEHDMLFVDDIEIFRRAPQALEQFLIIKEERRKKGNLLVYISDAGPSQWPADLFWPVAHAHNYHVDMPERWTMKEIARRYALKPNLDRKLSSEVLEAILDVGYISTREVVGHTAVVCMASKFLNRDVTPDFARWILEGRNNEASNAVT